MENKGLTVLIVDDEEMIVKLLGRFLEDGGFEVRTAATGEAALGVLGEERIDAAIVDVRLPDMSGDEVALKGIRLQPRTRFFIHTGSIDYALPPDLVAAGMDDSCVIHKPVTDLAELRRLIEEKVRG